MTTSCDADMKATATASSAKALRSAAWARSPASSNSAPASASCVSTSQPRRRPSHGRLEAVHQRRPQELEGVGQADQAQEADGRDVDAFDAEPGLHRLAGQRQRQARGEAEHGDDEQAVQRGQALRRGARDRFGSGRGGWHRGHSREAAQNARNDGGGRCTHSWNEIKSRAIAFAKDWGDASDERAQSQSFWIEFFAVFGLSSRRVASFEHAVKKHGGGQGFVDLFWPGMLLVEHKSRGKSLARAFNQALDYFPGIKERDLPATRWSPTCASAPRQPRQRRRSRIRPQRPAQAHPPLRLHRRLSGAADQATGPGQPACCRAHGPARSKARPGSGEPGSMTNLS